jgi:hypothetical protein
MKRLIVILLASTLPIGCGKSRPTYQLAERDIDKVMIERLKE